MRAQRQANAPFENEYEEKVRQFHAAFDLAIDENFTPELLELRKTLIAEEVKELNAEIDKAVAALKAGDKIPASLLCDMLKEMADVQYVLSGMAVSFGLPISEVYRRVHESNMSKLGEDGKPLRRADGKVLKGPKYHPPALDDLAE